MQTNLIVNPLATIDVDENGSLISGGPVPGRGMKYLTIRSADHPELHELFTDLRQVGLANLEIESDLRNGQLDLLREHGILIEPDNVPERPLFACMFDDVDPEPLNDASLIVNPTLEFLPFDLTKFRTWIKDQHLSPHLATVWVTDPQTDMRWGYWLTPDQASLVSRLEPGEKFKDEAFDGPTVARMKAASILVSSSDVHLVSDDNARASREFAEKKYAIVQDAVPAAQLRSLQMYYRGYVGQGFMQFGDEQVPRRFSEHGEHVAFMFQKNLQMLMRKIVGAPISPTYTHSAVYDEGAELVPHVDREACEYSFSFQLDFLPEPPDGVSPWPLYLSVNGMNVDPQNDIAIHLANGSCLAYKGRELVHYRTPLPAGQRSASLFFHYIPG